MKDSDDKQTLDLLDKPRRGRPVTGKAKTQAQIQREYRQRTKANGLPTLAQALAGFELWYLPKGCRKWRKFSGYDALSWEAVNSMYRSAIASNELISANDFSLPGLPENGASYEIRCTLERLPFLKRIDHFED